MTEKQMQQIPYAYKLEAGQGVRISEYSPFAGYIKQATIHWPAGCDGLVDVRIEHAGKQFLPNPDYGQRYLSLDATTPTFIINEPLKAREPLTVEIGNADEANPHTITVTIGVEGIGDVGAAVKTITSTFAYQTRGVGKPDYSKAVSSAIERFGIYLKYNQSLVIFGKVWSSVASAYAWIASPLASGATVHLMDIATGQDMPYTVPAGYGISFVEAETSHSEDLQGETYLDTYLAQSMGPLAAGVHTYIQRILGFSTITLDPTGASAHTADTQITNRGTGTLEGEVAIIALLEALGTEPLPTTKTVKCKQCGHEQVVPKDTTQVICPECGTLTIYYNLSRFRRTL